MFKKVKRPFVIITLLSITLSSCGVMFGGSKYAGTIQVKDHPKADIYVNGMPAGTGTATGLYPRNRPLVVEVRQEGCEPKSQTYINTFRTGNFIASLVTWGLIRIAIDLGTGASYKPDHINDPNIIRMSDKNYNFFVDYSGCTTAEGQ